MLFRSEPDLGLVNAFPTPLFSFELLEPKRYAVRR